MNPGIAFRTFVKTCTQPAAGLLSAVLLIAGAASAGVPQAPDGWSTEAPRDEIRPVFDYQPDGGRRGTGAFLISHDNREGLDGAWAKTFSVRGGQHYRFQAYRRLENVPVPRRSAVVKITWQDEQGRSVPTDRDIVDFYRSGRTSTAVPEYPNDGQEGPDGWTEVSDTYRVPAAASRALVELHLRWAPQGRAVWSDITLSESEPREQRKVRLATIHYRPKGGSPEANRKLFAPLIQRAADQQADLVVLPETLTYYGTGMTFPEVAEPVPGPSTGYFGELARQHDLYVVAGLVERDGPLLYNVAVLIGPDGEVAGKYRKVCLPRGEVAGGIAPGSEYPVFQTRFGKVGLMVCYDGFFPEVARELSNRGAEVIAWPVWGCNPLLAKARACENHVYLISSTYTDASTNWIVSAVYDHAGEELVTAREWGDVVVAEVDLNQPTQWSGIGDFRSEYPRHQPLRADEAAAR